MSPLSGAFPLAGTPPNSAWAFSHVTDAMAGRVNEPLARAVPPIHRLADSTRKHQITYGDPNKRFELKRAWY
jgi:hypothetical protein